MFDSSFFQLCPLHGFTTECTLDRQVKDSLAFPNQIKAFLLYQFDGDRELITNIHALLSSMDIRIFDAMLEPGLPIKSCKICRLALAANFGIALLSPLNLNVMFEVGFLYGLAKMVIFLVDSSKMSTNSLPFDIGDRTVITFQNAIDLEAGIRRELPHFIKELKVNISKQQQRRQSHNLAYEYLDSERYDYLSLDGTQKIKVNKTLLSWSDIPSYNDNIHSVSADCLPLEVIDNRIEITQSSRPISATINTTKEEPAGAEWRVIFEPQLRKGDIIELKSETTVRGHRPMSWEDMVEVFRYIGRHSPFVVATWRSLTIPVRKFVFKFHFPEKYKPELFEVYVMRGKQRIKSIEARLEGDGSFSKGINENGCYIGELRMENPKVNYNYGFAWIPPKKGEYLTLCKENGVVPQKLKCI